MSDDDPFNVQNIMDVIDTHGWVIIGTMTENGDPITYTVGLTFFRAPELFIDSLSITEGYRVLEELAQTHKGSWSFRKRSSNPSGGSFSQAHGMRPDGHGNGSASLR